MEVAFVYPMYVDESGDTSLNGSPSRYFALTGIVVHEQQWHAFITHLVNFRKTLKIVYGLPLRTEIHASEYIRNAVAGMNKHDRLSILRNCLDKLAKFSGISITGVIVDKLNRSPDDDVFQHAWRTLFQRFENTLRHKNFPGAFKDDFGMVLTDATDGQKLTKMVRKMSVHNPNSSSYGYEPRNIPIIKIIEDPHGKDSATSLPI